MKRWGIRAIVLTMALALLLGGCGSADRSSSNDAGAYESSATSSSNQAATDSKESLTSESPAADTGGNVPSGETAAESERASSGFQGTDSAAGLNKKLIYRANVVMEVKDYGKTQSEIRNLITLAGGYIVEFSENQSQHERGGNFVIKVPSSGFSSFLDRLEQLKPESLQQGIQGQDVSEEYVDLESRLKVKQAMEARYLKFVEEATKTAQLVEFVNELERIQTEIEQIKGRMRYIDNNVSFSTIEIRLYQPMEKSIIKQDEDKEPLFKRAQNALNGSIDAISVVLQWLVVVLSGALPLLLMAALILAIVWPIRRRNRSRRNRANWTSGQSIDRTPSLPGDTESRESTVSSPETTEEEDGQEPK
ncbi:DUF4349 domain-containing protein [Paenibacillus vini]|uniref:DUF4349 domain-containing protein n=1 Tax=Paenibacillus vini TaxID=1476024 RepID=UPI0025B71CDE|nr:DUF4349 domain-containing protein [Paenibacillus vini]MDN4070355.1 DUF4349 domain-containing protein [Paenibacillus vini]